MRQQICGCMYELGICQLSVAEPSCRSVAFGQRAPNRATAREEGRGLGAGMKGGAGQSHRSPDRPKDKDRDRCATAPCIKDLVESV